WFLVFLVESLHGLLHSNTISNAGTILVAQPSSKMGDVKQGNDNLDENRDSYVKAWRELCHDFFNKPNESEGIPQSIIDLFQKAQQQHYKDHTKDAPTVDVVLDLQPSTSSPPPPLDPTLLQRLTQAGLNPDGTLIFPQDTKLYNDIKNQARREFHTTRAHQFEANLARLLAAPPHTLRQNIISTSSASTTTPSFAMRIHALSSFVQMYRAEVGVQPFLKGLVAFLDVQRRRPGRFVSWRFDDEVLAQGDEGGGGGAGNGRDAVGFVENGVWVLRVVLGLDHSRKGPPCSPGNGLEASDISSGAVPLTGAGQADSRRSNGSDVALLVEDGGGSDAKMRYWTFPTVSQASNSQQTFFTRYELTELYGAAALALFARGYGRKMIGRPTGKVEITEFVRKEKGGDGVWRDVVDVIWSWVSGLRIWLALLMT
ncbi:hypothetical protein HK102_005205, partial [Quaeritorhiza haematococci]